MDPYTFKEVKHNNSDKKVFFDSESNSTIIFNNNSNGNWEKDFFNKTIDSRLQVADTIKQYPELNKYFRKNYSYVNKDSPISNYVNKNYKELLPSNQHSHDATHGGTETYRVNVLKTVNNVTEEVLSLEIDLEQLEQIKKYCK